MSHQRPHTAKVRALLALNAGRLGPSGEARLQRHVAVCALCDATWRAVQVHESLTREVRETAPDVDWTTMELAMRQQARIVVQRRRMTHLALPIALAAIAAALLLFVRPLSHQPVTRKVALAPAQPSASPIVLREPKRAPLLATVTALRGHATVAHTTSTTEPLGLASALAEGERLEVAADSEAHLLLAEDTGMIVGPGSVVTLTHLRQGDIQLELLSGKVTSQVRHLAAGERYEVLALGYTTAVRGTHFEVSIEGGSLAVSVEEGRVVVTDPSRQVVGDVTAPGTFSVQDGVGHPAALRLPKPRVLTLPLSAWPQLVLPRLSNVAAWRIDGSTFAASAELAMRAPQGELTLFATLDDGRERQVTVRVPFEGLRVGDETLRVLTHPELDERRGAGVLRPEAIMSVVQAGLPLLQRCYERSLKQRPDVGGRLTMRITVDSGGRVARATLRGEVGGVPEDLVACIREAASRWHFAAPGGTGVTFDSPIRLSHHN